MASKKMNKAELVQRVYNLHANSCAFSNNPPVETPESISRLTVKELRQLYTILKDGFAKSLEIFFAGQAQEEEEAKKAEPKPAPKKKAAGNRIRPGAPKAAEIMGRDNSTVTNMIDKLAITGKESIASIWAKVKAEAEARNLKTYSLREVKAVLIHRCNKMGWDIRSTDSTFAGTLVVANLS